MATTIKAVFSNQNIFPLGSKPPAYLLSQTGFAFTRNCATSVQTSASTVDMTALTHYPTFGCMRSDTLIPSGLVIQQRVRNMLITAPIGHRRFLGGSWIVTGTGINTYPSESPTVNPAGYSGTGVGGTFSYVPSGTFGPYFDHGADTAVRYTYSHWFKSRVNFQAQITNSATNAFTFFNAGASNTWQRAVIVKGTASRRYWVSLEARAWTGGDVAQLREAYMDYAQVEAGDWPSECQGDVGNIANREPDCLRWPDGTQILTAGQVHFRAIFTPKFASTMEVYNCTSGATVAATAYHFLYSWGVTGENRAAIKYSDHKLYVKFNNTGEITSSVAMAWSQYDLVEIEVKAGSNLTSVARYRLNNGSWVDLTLANVVQIPAPTGEVGILHDVHANSGDLPESFPCWLHEVEFLGTTAGVTPVAQAITSASMCHGLHEHQTTTDDTLVLVPSKSGRAIVRVEKSQATPVRGPYPGST